MATPIDDVESGIAGPSNRSQQTRLNENLLALGKLRSSKNLNNDIKNGSTNDEISREASAVDVENLPLPPSYDSVVLKVKDEMVSLPSSSQLPRYQDVAGVDNGPPTYHSLFSDKMFRVINPFADDTEDMNSVVIDPQGRCKFATMALNSLLFVFLVTFVLLLPIGMISIGIIYVHSCPVQPRIPIYLIVLGFFQMLECCGRLGYKLFQNGQQQNGWRERYRRKDPLVYFVIVWFVIGSMWVYQTDPNCKDCTDIVLPTSSLNHTSHHNITSMAVITTASTTANLKSTDRPSSVMYCNSVIYNFAFWIITTYYSVIGFFCLMLIVDVTLRTINRCFCPQR